MFDWFADLSPTARYGAALIVLAAAGIFFLCGYLVIWLWVVGIVLFFSAMMIKD